MNIMDIIEPEVNFGQLAELVTIMENDGVECGDKITIDCWGIADFVVTAKIDNDSFNYYHVTRGEHPYKCTTCHECRYSDIIGEEVWCFQSLYGYSMSVGTENDPLPACRCFVKK